MDCLLIDRRQSPSAPPSPDTLRRNNNQIHSFTSTIESVAGMARDISTGAEGHSTDSGIGDRVSAGGEQNFSDYLVITCEGNGSYYEMGVMLNLIPQSYSILGWNHPGFGDSGGIPTLESEEKSIEAMIDVATKKLGFSYQ